MQVISHVKEELREIGHWWEYRFWPRLVRITSTTWFILGIAFLVAVLLFGGLFTLFRYADRQSMESTLRIIASTVATFVGFILVALALIAGRASDAREHLEAVAPRYKDSSGFDRIRSDYLQALSSQPLSLDESPMLGPYLRPCPYTHGEIYAALEAIHLMLLRRLAGMPGAKNVIMGMGYRGLSRNKIDWVLENYMDFDRQPYKFFRALERVLELEYAYFGQPVRHLPSRGFLRELREKWESDRISASLDRVERHQRATGRYLWVAVLSSIVALVGSVLLTLGLTDVTLQLITMQISLVSVIVIWSMAIVLIIAYLTQLLSPAGG